MRRLAISATYFSEIFMGKIFRGDNRGDNRGDKFTIINTDIRGKLPIFGRF